MVKEVITVREYTQDILSKSMAYDLVLLDLDDVVLTTQTYLSDGVFLSNEEALSIGNK